MADETQQPTQVSAPSEAPLVVATPTTQAPTGTPQQQTREQVYQKYYGDTLAAQAPTPTPTEPTSAPAEPVVTDPAPTAPTTSQPAIDPAVMRQLVNEAIRSMMPTTPTPATPAVTPAVPVAEPVDPNAWVQQLIAGDFTKATTMLKAQIMEEVKANLAPELSRNTLAEATESFKAETELTSFVNSIRESNADIIKLEPLIAPKIQIQMSEWLQSQGGKVAPLTYVEHYKKVATAEINEARTLIQSFRAAGATGQQQVKQEVLSASTLTPSPVQAPQVPTGQPQVQDAKSYITMRNELTNMRNGMKLRT